ncbi:MAG TPA: hypothetical protein VN958_04565 [Chitinophagaceae bacterium]|nr:hypothetical protein [Chitinophagaceae bacterium]
MKKLILPILFFATKTNAQLEKSDIHTDSMTVCMTDIYGRNKCLDYVAMDGRISIGEDGWSIIFFKGSELHSLMVYKYLSETGYAIDNHTKEEVTISWSYSSSKNGNDFIEDIISVLILVKHTQLVMI